MKPAYVEWTRFDGHLGQIKLSAKAGPLHYMTHATNGVRFTQLECQRLKANEVRRQ
jgi:hypothetical protein